MTEWLKMFSTRARFSLSRSGIHSQDELYEAAKKHSIVKGIGEKTIVEINNAVDEFSVKLTKRWEVVENEWRKRLEAKLVSRLKLVEKGDLDETD